MSTLMWSIPDWNSSGCSVRANHSINDSSEVLQNGTFKRTNVERPVAGRGYSDTAEIERPKCAEYHHGRCGGARFSENGGESNGDEQQISDA